MRMLFTPRHAAPALALALSLTLLAGLSGCASKNPLIDGPDLTSNARSDATVTPAAGTRAADSAAIANAGAQTTGPSGLQRVLGIFTPYRVDIQQGNFVSQEMVSQLKEGQTPEQVRFILGTPLLTDIFHAERWDYPFRLQKNNGEITTSRVTVFFKDNRMTRFEGGNLPTEQDYLARIAGSQGSQQAAAAIANNATPDSPAAPAK